MQKIVLRCWRNILSRSLFIGDSHSSGYSMQDMDKPEPWPKHWGQANYAEFYSTINNKEIVLYAQPNGCNKKYPLWLKSMFDKYDDIDEVFIQSTYWGRDLLAASKNLDIGDGIKSNHFMVPAEKYDGIPFEKSKLITRWTDHQVTDDYVEKCVRTAPDSKHLEYKGFDFDELENGMDITTAKPYAYVKLWHEHITHLQYRDYCSFLFIIDTLCKTYGVKWHLWNINERVVIPKQLDLYGTLENCIRTDVSAETFIKNKHNISIADKTSDGEHYETSVHDLIAKEFIPYLKELDKT